MICGLRPVAFFTTEKCPTEGDQPVHGRDQCWISGFGSWPIARRVHQRRFLQVAAPKPSPSREVVAEKALMNICNTLTRSPGTYGSRLMRA